MGPRTPATVPRAVAVPVGQLACCGCFLLCRRRAAKNGTNLFPPFPPRCSSSALLPGRDAISGGVRVAQRPVCRPTPRARCDALVCASPDRVLTSPSPPPSRAPLPPRSWRKQRDRRVVGVGGPARKRAPMSAGCTARGGAKSARGVSARRALKCVHAWLRACRAGRRARDGVRTHVHAARAFFSRAEE